ncbi:hypothetical protein VTK73DRAFT_8489 [Phialemonium thermophilum]|uniref:Uncharacterized protein n=1 Tax=Phialemonium thermophilum TaxID=223376 RepID=A0ABR3XPA7_9PEZI
MAPSDPPEPPKSLLSRLNGWGTSSMPPMGLATLITALHFRPFQPLPMLFAPLLLFSSYLNVAGFKIDSAGMTAAWSGLYVLLAARRARGSRGLFRLPFLSLSSASPAAPARRGFFSARSAVSAAAMGLGTVNCLAGGWVYATGDRKAEDAERREMNRWGVYKD